VIAKAAVAAGGANGVVGTLMSNLGFEHAVGRLGLPFARAKVGDRYVLELMHANGWKLGAKTPVTSSAWIATPRGWHHRRSAGAGCAAPAECQARRHVRRPHFYPQKLVNVPIKPGFAWADSEAICCGDGGHCRAC
jgi:phosphoglucosamine mutase